MSEALSRLEICDEALDELYAALEPRPREYRSLAEVSLVFSTDSLEYVIARGIFQSRLIEHPVITSFERTATRITANYECRLRNSIQSITIERLP